ncbi:MAG: hypothetical protein OEV44_00260 [Spirochaetota bacterium]|nr:hypothetical protein [Spirochaetota bacterium]
MAQQDEKIKRVIVDKDYLDNLQKENKELKDCFGYRFRIIRVNSFLHERIEVYSKEDFKELIKMSIIKEILDISNRRNKKKINAILEKYNIKL